jgi:hypothetical protein
MTESLFPPEICRNGIPLGVRARRKIDVGHHPFVVEKSKVSSIDKIRGNPVIFRYKPGYGQEQMAYYRPANPQTETQQAWRAVFADAVAAWQALSEEEKQAWRRKGTRRSKMGYSLFLSRYLDGHKL